MKDDKPMKQSKASIKGGTGGSVADTSMADLERGYSDANTPGSISEGLTERPRGGVVGRPRGWER